MRVTPQSLPIPQTQAPSAPSSSPCPENAEKKASEAESEWLRWPYPTTRKPWCKSNRVPLCQATLSIGLYLLLEGPVPTKILYLLRRRVSIQIHTLPCPCRELRGWLLRRCACLRRYIREARSEKNREVSPRRGDSVRT